MGASAKVELVEALVQALATALAGGEGITRRPASTYRLQLHAKFGFEAAADLVPYLAELGISDLYLSPILAAAPGSTHGYDVVDHARLNPELGGDEGFARLAAAAAANGMGILLDFVPNHMGIGKENAWWMDVLENGPSSVHAPAFDVDWTPLKAELGHKVLVPILGDQFGRVLERGELTLVREGGSFFIRYFEHVFPVAPRSVPQVLRFRLDALKEELGASDPGVQDLESICTALEKLAPRTETSPEAVAERAREKEVAKRRLGALCDSSERVRAFVDENVRIFNGTPGDARSFDLLHRLLDGQAYRLAFWRVAGEEINYRRFFDVNGLAAIRMEDPRVFTEAHRLVLGLVRDGKASGLRIDHPDGLHAPTAYFRRLQAAYLVERGRLLAQQRGEPLDAATEALLLERLTAELEAGRLPRRPLYVVVEKVLVAPEKMPDGWDVDGTTGYEFLAALNGVFVDPAAERAFDTLYSRIAGAREDFREVMIARKRLVMESSMASEINMLAHRLARISEMDRRTRDFTQRELTRTLVEYVSLFPVYRTYVSPRGEVHDRDRRYVEETIARARRRSPVVDPSIYDFLRDVILQRYADGLSDADRREWLELALKLQQVTGPVTAKAVEDTAFYAYVRLASLNEVGGEPRRFGTTPEDLHALLAERQARYPGSLSATSTHDTKRSEDVRVRIDALSEIPGDARAAWTRFTRMNRSHLTRIEGRTAPDRRDEWLVYQTLLGTWPDGGLAPGSPALEAYEARIHAYVEKALREAKVHTSWTNPDAEYEQGVHRFVQRVLASPPFVAELAALAARLARAGRVSSLAQVAVKCFAPGVPDVYQGTELWDLSLVDPDNRRPVDYEVRRRVLAEVRAERARGGDAVRALARRLSTPDALVEGRAKLLLLHAALAFRRERLGFFLQAEHRPLAANGPHAAHVLAFARSHGGRAVVCAVPRLVLRLLEEGEGQIRWEGALPLPEGLPRRWRDVVTGAVHDADAPSLGALFADFPVALLASE
ncbi:malto-oligosyltrehalose synthase [Anaeromyxobacter oryzae]|uniref:Maltooligosyl trehalose synthase n=1 Tax=Anaeromyxobacter oryzae TaxID=2918170 RepID=A0ABM7WWN7_9BACT|nr:malto-oligosyltrehalose synthase [Anaeromyxobacter oryzae]BDG03882.1 maltooligosyl trehalose synthase [Anaeromyxobacter oryzae]